MKIQIFVQLDKDNPGIGNIRGLNLAAVKPTTVQVSNCCFLGLNKLRHRLLHYPALTDVPVYSTTLCQFVFCEFQTLRIQSGSVDLLTLE
jgi:hypothetical protein